MAGLPFTQIYLLNLRDRSKLVFEQMPFSFAEAKNANYADIGILGRSEPIKGYANSGPRQFNLNLKFVAETSIELQVQEKVRWVRSLVYPDYSASFIRTPPPVVFTVGTWMSSRCVAISYNVVRSAPWDRFPVETVMPYVAEVDLILHEANSDGARSPFDWKQVKIGSDRNAV